MGRRKKTEPAPSGVLIFDAATLSDRVLDLYQRGLSLAGIQSTYDLSAAQLTELLRKAHKRYGASVARRMTYAVDLTKFSPEVRDQIWVAGGFISGVCGERAVYQTQSDFLYVMRVYGVITPKLADGD